MAEIYLICGKICSGKTHYAESLKEKYNAVILSVDELTYELTGNEQGDSYDKLVVKAKTYLRKKAAEICSAGTDVILDWGFWTKAEREDISQYFESLGLNFEWHYMDISDSVWKMYIDRRNNKVKEGSGGSDFYVDEVLLAKLESLFETPSKEETDVWKRTE